ncbi:MAG: preprotein translocase subunit YajC [Actinomycetales bacterium]|nr:preprotein translocase subunit YajC [Actinomycetales bacterium]
MDPIGLLLLVVAGAAFYFMIIRPGRQRQKAQQEMAAALQPGVEIMTVGGIFGTVAAVTDEEISVEVSPGVHMRMVPAAVAKVIEPKPVEDDPVD